MRSIGIGGGARIGRGPALPCAALAAAVAAACQGGSSGGPCSGVDCSGHGSCFVRTNTALCACDAGYHPVFLACVEDDPGDPCAGVDCSGHGACVASEGRPHCACDPGYASPPESDLYCFLVAGADADGDADGPPDDVAPEDADADDADAGPRCGNGVLDPGEDCDEGEENSDTEPDACRTDCLPARCGDRVTDTGEACDDGNDEPGDGCESDCSWTCSADEECLDEEECDGDEACAEHVCAEGIPLPEGTPCTLPEGPVGICRRGSCAPVSCGDAIVDVVEECDDGNGIDGDGCESDCTFSCHGDGECDDGNECTDDACVTVDTGQACAATPRAGDRCDDGDGCTTGDVCGRDGACAGEPIAPGVPVPSFPENGAATGSVHAPDAFGVLRPRFRWRPPPADGCPAPVYEIEVDDSCSAPGFASCGFPSLVAFNTVAATEWHPAANLPAAVSPPVGRRYYWRVRACRGSSCSAWGPVRYVDVGRVRGDMNGDGYSDVVAGAPQNAAGATGRAYVYFGGASPDSTADLVLAGDAERDWLGGAVAIGGDVNADGYADVIVGASQNDGGGTDAGRAYLLLGGAAPDRDVDVVFTGNVGDHLGQSVAIGGDVNADGYADVLAGLHRYDRLTPGLADVGRAYLYLGGTPPDSEQDVAYTGEAAGDFLGWSAAIGGDVNGDGAADVLVGAPQTDTSGSDGGVVHLCFGGASPDASPDVVFAGATDEQLGRAVSLGGDYDGDDYADVILGGAPIIGAASGPGVVRVFLGGPAPGPPPAAEFPGGAGDHQGYSVAVGGDLNADGYADLAFGAPRFDAGGGAADAGRVYVYLGGSPPDFVHDLLPTGTAWDFLGWSVAFAGDVNGDGYDDLAVGAPGNDTGGAWAGQVHVYFGGPAPEATADVTFTGAEAYDNLGYSVM